MLKKKKQFWFFVCLFLGVPKWRLFICLFRNYAGGRMGVLYLFDTQTKNDRTPTTNIENAISQTHSPNLQTKQNIATTLLILPPGWATCLYVRAASNVVPPNAPYVVYTDANGQV